MFHQLDRHQLEQVARDRHKLHEGQASHRPLSTDYQLVGLAGEFAFGQKYFMDVDWTLRPAGDNGTDFKAWIGNVDVKTFQKPIHLLVEVGKARADYYVLGGCKATGNVCEVQLLGWATKAEVLGAEQKTFDVLSHAIHQKKLHDMRWLDMLLL